MRQARAALAAIVAGALLAGCSLAPAYHAPQIAATAAYKEAGPWQTAGAAPMLSGPWWTLFADPVLDDLEARIEGANPSLAAAVARYDQARGRLAQAHASLLPEVDANAGVLRTRVPADRPLSSGTGVTYNEGTLGASLAYELDLFGRLRNTAAAASASAQASASDVAGVRLGLQATLASDYFAMRGLDARIDLLRQTVSAYGRAFDLTNTRHSGGIASGIDVSRSASQLSSAKAELSGVVADRAAYEHAIAVLVGESPSRFAIPVAGAAPPPPPAIPAGVPSTLLERRPDIRAAERRVAAANAEIGVARAALYPSLTLGASGGFEAASGALLSASSGFWALGPLEGALAVFDGGRRRAGVRIARAQFDEAADDYRQTVLTAFREVEDDLARARQLIDEERNEHDAATAAERTRDLALTRYHDGAADYLEVVTAQNEALDAERAWLQVRTDQLQTTNDLIRALGGSWSAPQG